jgi:hypothetical protein
MRDNMIRREVGRMQIKLAAAVARIRSQEPESEAALVTSVSGVRAQDALRTSRDADSAPRRPTGESAESGGAYNRLALRDDEWLCAADIAEAEGVNFDAFRKRLHRWQRKHDDGWQQVTDRKPRAPKYLYRVGAIRHLIRPRAASSESSSERPANENPRT